MTADMAEVVAGRAILGDFQREAREFTVGTRMSVDWLSWALRLSQHLQALLDALSRASGHQGAAGGAWLAPGDLHTALLALADAQEFTDAAMRDRYGSLARTLSSQAGGGE